MKEYLKRVRPYLSILFFLAALYLVHHELKVHGIGEIARALHEMPRSWLFLGLGLVAANYLVLAGYDFLALRYLGKNIPHRKVLLASFLSYAITNNTGYAWIVGSSMRYRFYSPLGLSGLDIVKCVMFNSWTNLLGIATLYSVIVLAGLPFLASTVPHAFWLQALAWVMMAAMVGYGVALGIRKSPLVVRGMEVPLPTVSITVAQMLIASIELVLGSLVLYVLLGSPAQLPFSHFLVLYLVSLVLGLFSQIPGGLGVFEGSFLFLLGGTVPAPVIAAALLGYRILYYFLPLILAGIILLLVELRVYRRNLQEHAADLLALLSPMVPHVFSILLTLSGVLLLVSGSTPTSHGALKWLNDTLPLGFVEASHLLASLIGFLILLVARAVRQRLDAAYPAVVILLSLGAVFTFLKGFDWQEALVLAGMLILFLPTRPMFYRKSSLLDISLSRSWLSLMAIFLLGTFWIGMYSYRHVEYRHDLWWQFSYEGDAHRFLRASLTIAVLAVAFAMYRLLRPVSVAGHIPTAEELNELALVVRKADEAQSHLALLGDKSVLWSESRQACILYGITRNFWVGMGDPVGPLADQESLVWAFKEKANRQGAEVAFYQVSKNRLPLFLDMGLILVKMGEEARVPLETFGLEGGKRSGLRQTQKRFAKLGIEFEVLERDQVATHIKALKQISDAWLEQKKAKEKGFSLGYFDEAYLCRMRVAVARLNGEILAFANLWELDDKEEVSIDLMRYGANAPAGVMEYLFISLMLWGKEQGYRWFNLGMAPLSGLEKHPLAPLWHKIGNIIFEHGESLYHFEGLRAYKEKFHPEWEPRYLAAPPLKVPSVLLAITSMVSGGLTGVIRK